MSIRHILSAAALVLAIGAAMVSCSSPFGPDSTDYGPGAGHTAGADHDPGAGHRGSLVIGGSTLGAATVLPEMHLDNITTYRVIVHDGPGGAGKPPVRVPAGSDGSFQGPLEIADLVPGVWAVTMEALRGDHDNETTVLRGTATDIRIKPGEAVYAKIDLSPPREGTGTLIVSAAWPADQGVTALEYRITPMAMNAPALWTSISSDTFAVTFSEELPSGTHILTVRLDYRAYSETVIYVFDETSTVVNLELTEDHFSVRPVPPGGWEDLVDQGAVIINPDGSITFTDSGYTSPQGGSSILVDPDDYSITFGGSGERQLFMEMPSVSRARLEIYNALMTKGNGWGVFFHGSANPGSQGAESFTGYTLQFDAGMQDAIIVRPWVSGQERAPFIFHFAQDLGIDLRAPKNVFLELDGHSVTVQVEQPPGAEPVTVFAESDITAVSGFTGPGPDSGFLGLRNWNTTDLTVEEIRLYLPGE